MTGHTQPLAQTVGPHGPGYGAIREGGCRGRGWLLGGLRKAWVGLGARSVLLDAAPGSPCARQAWAQRS